ncbi:uncharacterized protein LOC121807943 [Salvia splendens]|uniref:uncharacterized protein LOC121807943 n=1 Tax=Salvia splendens TaxID=180675 RepID=UPI001C265314|nr:uncharacterized protein LOC121807943 [Salvia splendens]
MEEPAGRDSRMLGGITKNLIAQSLLQASQAGEVPYEGIEKAAKEFGVSRRTVHIIWAEAQLQLQSGVPVNIRDRVRGYEHKDKFQLDVAKVRELSVLERSNTRKLAAKLDVSKTTVGRFVKEQHLRLHTNALKPLLSGSNKLARMRWGLSHVPPLIVNGKLKYHTMHNVVHIDEKWFYMTKTSDRYYLLPDENEPYRAYHILQKMDKYFLMENRHFPIHNYGASKEKIQEQTKRDYGDKAHSISEQGSDERLPNSKDFLVVAFTDGFKFHIRCQPPQSPYCNVLDLGYFRAIQYLHDDKVAKGVDDLLRNVHSSFDELSAHTLHNVFFTLQCCLTEILKVEGGNDYKTSHMNKERLTRIGTLP